MSECSHPYSGLVGSTADRRVSAAQARDERQQLTLNLHPHDYLLIEAAARRRGFSLPEFIELAAYHCAREIVVRGDEMFIPANYSVTHGSNGR